MAAAPPCGERRGYCATGGFLGQRRLPPNQWSQSDRGWRYHYRLAGFGHRSRSRHLCQSLSRPAIVAGPLSVLVLRGKTGLWSPSLQGARSPRSPFTCFPRIQSKTADRDRTTIGDVTAVSGANIDGGADAVGARPLAARSRPLVPFIRTACQLHSPHLWCDLGQTPQHIIKDSALRTLRLIFASQHITAKFNRIAPILRNPNDPLT